METVSWLVLVLIVCILGHVSSVWWLSSLMSRSAGEIDDRIGEIDQGLGMLAARLLDPNHWSDLIGEIQPQMNPLEMILSHFVNSPNDDYNRNNDGTFHGTPEIIETTGSTQEDVDQPSRNG